MTPAAQNEASHRSGLYDGWLARSIDWLID